MTKLILTSFLVVLYVCTCEGVSESSCTTPSGGNGTCMPVHKCPSLMTVVNNPMRTPEDVQLARKSLCGYDGFMPKVCCPNENCYTPDGQRGACVDIYSCPHLLNMLKSPTPPENIEYVKKFRCGSEQQRNVCCGPPSTSQLETYSCGSCAMTSSPPDPRSCCCGEDAAPNDKIFGGEYAYLDKYPWLTLIEYHSGDNVTVFCGGALISGRYVLTAAHCIKQGEPVYVRLGEYNTSNPGIDCVQTFAGGLDCDDGITVIPVEKTILYNKNDGKSSDIALLRLKQMAPYTDFIRPICLPTFNITANPANSNLYVAGWGATGEVIKLSPTKKYGRISLAKCPGENLGDGTICADDDSNKDFCKGDSGGPLVYEVNGHHEAVGIASNGPKPCGQTSKPGSYINVYEYMQWILDNIEP